MAIGKVHPGEDAKIDASGTRVLIMKDADTGNVLMPVVETDPARAQRVAPYVWDSITGAFVKAELKGQYWNRLFPYTHASGRPLYICKNTDINAVVADTDWVCWKYTDAGIPQVEGPRVATGGIASQAAVDALAWNI